MQGLGDRRHHAPPLPAVVSARPLSHLVPAGADDALDRAGQPHLFDRIGWLETLHRLCMPGSTPHVLHAQEDGAQAWLFLADPGGDGSAPRRTAIANYYSFAFRPIFVGHPDADQRVHLVQSIAQDLGREVARVDMFPVPDDDGTAALLLSAFRKAGWIAVSRPMGVNHYLEVGGRDFATYWAERPGALRNTVRRKQRDTGLTFSVHDSLTDALWEDYITVYRRSWKPSEPGLDFLRSIAEQEGRAGTLRLGFARDHGHPVATQFWTVENGVALIHKLAHDQGADDASPGTLLSHFLFRHAIDQDRVAIIDYGTGDNGYKTGWMDRQRPLQRVDCFNPRFSSTWLPAARTAISKLIG
ncbi:GNAT family N-acetyltransferase [soil metagenome]